jgi:hypothetical protein
MAGGDLVVQQLEELVVEREQASGVQRTRSRLYDR